jgi:putative acyl-CoA dehydrogenase
MTEKQGGSDLRANTTQAIPAGDGWYELTGHKWFCTHPVFDVFLTLAQAPGGITCFVATRPDPGFRLQRLKDKLGGRCLASSEVEYARLPARILGEEGRGTAFMIEQIVWTRLDTLLGTAGIVRRAVAEATWHARHRSALGAPLAQQPAMRNVLADLALESEAMLAAAMRIVRGAAGPAVPRRAARHRLGGLGQRHRPRRTARDAPQPRRGAGADGRARGRDRRRPALRRAPERGQVFLGHTGSWCGKE